MITDDQRGQLLQLTGHQLPIGWPAAAADCALVRALRGRRATVLVVADGVADALVGPLLAAGHRVYLLHPLDRALRSVRLVVDEGGPAIRVHPCTACEPLTVDLFVTGCQSYGPGRFIHSPCEALRQRYYTTMHTGVVTADTRCVVIADRQQLTDGFCHARCLTRADFRVGADGMDQFQQPPPRRRRRQRRHLRRADEQCPAGRTTQNLRYEQLDGLEVSQ